MISKFQFLKIYYWINLGLTLLSLTFLYQFPSQILLICISLFLVAIHILIAIFHDAILRN